jgi:hypothetical protein
MGGTQGRQTHQAEDGRQAEGEWEVTPAEKATEEIGKYIASCVRDGGGIEGEIILRHIRCVEQAAEVRASEWTSDDWAKKWRKWLPKYERLEAALGAIADHSCGYDCGCCQPMAQEALEGET